MILNVKTTSINFAVVSLFIVAGIGTFKNLSPLTTCKRAAIAAVVTYIIAKFALRMVNSIMVNAAIEKHVSDKQKQLTGGGDE